MNVNAANRVIEGLKTFHRTRLTDVVRSGLLSSLSGRLDISVKFTHHCEVHDNVNDGTDCSQETVLHSYCTSIRYAQSSRYKKDVQRMILSRTLSLPWKRPLC